jgi:hypothetical protein
VNHRAFNNPPSIELADALTATLVKRFPKKWGAQIKRACEDSFASFLDTGNSNTTYSIRSGRLLYLAIPKWAASSDILSLDVEVVYMRAHVSGAIISPQEDVERARVPSPIMEGALRHPALVELPAGAGEQ